MDRELTVYLLIALPCLLLGTISACFVVQSRKQNRQRQQRDENQANRERLAARRIAENGGQPLSAQYATSNTDRRQSERSV
jgi:hypothetical protein